MDVKGFTSLVPTYYLVLVVVETLKLVKPISYNTIYIDENKRGDIASGFCYYFVLVYCHIDKR